MIHSYLHSDLINCRTYSADSLKVCLYISLFYLNKYSEANTMTCKLVNGLFFLQARVNGQGFNNIYMLKSTIIQITFEICYMYMSVIHSLIDI